MRRRLLPIVLLAGLVAAPAAKGVSAKPKPANRIGVQVAGAFPVGARQVAVMSRRLSVEGRIVPYVAGQQVSVRIWRGHTLIKRVTVTPRPTRTKATATFRVDFVPHRAGDLQIFALHEQTPEQPELVARARVSVVDPSARPGSHGLFVALLQQRLAAVRYAVPSSGVYDPGTERAVLAFRKVNGMPRVTTLSPTVVDRLMRGVGAFRIRYPSHGHHVEANLGWQVLALIDKGKVVRAYVTSSGKPSTPTVLGHFRFYSKTPGTNAKQMVNANYFIRGYAIHGYFDVPPYNASHGCLRVPIPDSWAIYSWIRLGDRIDVYY